MKTRIKRIAVKYILIYCSLLLSFVAVLTLVCALPNESLKGNILASVPVMREEGWRHKLADSEQSTLDGFTDQLMAEMQFVVDPARPFASAVIAHREDGDYLGIIERVAGGGPAVTDNYARYWHGYAVWLRPLLLFLDYSQTRTAMSVIFYGLALAVMFLIYKRAGLLFVIPFALALFAAYFPAIPACWQYFSVYLLTLSACIYILTRLKDASFAPKLPRTLFVIGALTCFLDLLTAPLVAYGFPMILAFLVIYRRKYLDSGKDRLLLAGRMTLAWGFGFGALWGSKWIVADIFFGLGTIDFGLNKLNLLTYGEVKYNPARLWWKMPFMAAEYSFQPYTLLTAVFFAAAAAWIVWFGIARREKGFLPILGAGLLPVIWYMVVFVHSYAHVFMTFRTLSVSVLAVLTALMCVYAETFRIPSQTLRRVRK